MNTQTQTLPVFDNYGNVSVGNYVGGIDGLPDAYALQCSINADLLEALQKMLFVFDGVGGTDSPACKAARAAVARAKGQA